MQIFHPDEILAQSFVLVRTSQAWIARENR
jgi:hypothetical protein